VTCDVHEGEFFLYECRVCNGKCLMTSAGGELTSCECEDFGGRDPDAINLTRFVKAGHGWRGEFLGTLADMTSGIGTASS
jgi:hypothetical protein